MVVSRGRHGLGEVVETGIGRDYTSYLRQVGQRVSGALVETGRQLACLHTAVKRKPLWTATLAILYTMYFSQISRVAMGK